MSLDNRTTRDPTLGHDRFPRTAAAVIGATFVLVGVLGFVPGVTTDLDSLQWAGHHSDAKLIGLFEVSGLHNVLHLALGVVGLAAARKASWSVGYLFVGGLAYLALWIYGLAVDSESDANVVPLNNADDWLHLVLSLGMLALGVLTYRTWRGDIGSQSPM